MALEKPEFCMQVFEDGEIPASKENKCSLHLDLNLCTFNSGKNLYYFFLDAFSHVSEYIYHELIKFTKGDKQHDSWFNLSKTLIILLQVDRSLAKMSCQQNQQQCQPPPKLPPSAVPLNAPQSDPWRAPQSPPTALSTPGTAAARGVGAAAWATTDTAGPATADPRALTAEASPCRAPGAAEALGLLLTQTFGITEKSIEEPQEWSFSLFLLTSWGSEDLWRVLFVPFLLPFSRQESSVAYLQDALNIVHPILLKSPTAQSPCNTQT